MPLFLLKYWKSLAFFIALIAFGAGCYLKGRADVTAAYELRLAKLDRDAADLLTQLTETAANIGKVQAEFARNLDEAHDDEERRIAAAALDAERDFNDRLRRIAAGRPRCPSPATAETADPGSDPGGSAGSQDQLLDEAARSLGEIGEGAEVLATTVKLCVAWAHEVGR